MNLFLYRPGINLGATIEALVTKNLAQILAEPNVLAADGEQASFLAGGEFPYPVLQSSTGGINNVTIQFRQFGIRLTFTPTITPRGTIKLIVEPEVSSLDYTNGLNYGGFTVPGLSVRRVKTDIELENGQSFAIAGLLDNTVTEQLSKIPGLGNIPLLGKLFQSRSVSKANSELLVVVTPELVQPNAATPAPGLNMPSPFLKADPAPAIDHFNPPAAGTAPSSQYIPFVPAPIYHQPARGNLRLRCHLHRRRHSQAENGNADLSYVEAVACEIARSLASYKVIVEKSTVPVYTNEWIRRTIERNGVARSLFDVVSNPDSCARIAVSDFLHPDRIVVGADTDSAASLMEQIYAPLTTGAYYAHPDAIPGACSAASPPPLIAPLPNRQRSSSTPPMPSLP